jgi:AbrB family looped-hinge helix DNA binding protein
MRRVYHSKLAEGRRIAIPAEVCEKLRLSPGEPVSIEVHDDGLRLVPYAEVIRKIQQASAPYCKPGVSVVDELIGQRCREAAQEENE